MSAKLGPLKSSKIVRAAFAFALLLASSCGHDLNTAQGVAEEFVDQHYVAIDLQKAKALAVSVALRALCHIYQDYGVIFIVVFGLVLTGCYARYGRLWPLIVAHVIFDFFPLQAYQG